MNTAIESSTGTFSGIGFAIPSNTIAKIVPTLIEKGYYLHPYLGLTLGTLTSDLAQDAGVPVNLKGICILSTDRRLKRRADSFPYHSFLSIYRSNELSTLTPNAALLLIGVIRNYVNQYSLDTPE